MAKKPDGRSKEARALKTYYQKFMGASGKKNPELCRMAAGLAVRLDEANDAWARGEITNPATYARLVGALGRTLGALGLADWLTAPAEEKPDPLKTLQDHIGKKDNPQ